MQYENKTFNYTVISPERNTEALFLSSELWMPFSDSAMCFIEALSQKILNDPVMHDYPELIAMAFWMRKSHVEKIKNDFLKQKNARTLFYPRGVAFHIAPSNLDTVFVYSWLHSFLMGNLDIVRLPSVLSTQLKALLRCISYVCESHAAVSNRFLLVQYGHDASVNQHFSQLCDLRIVWGGDETIQNIRAFPIKPTAAEVVFADKFSFCVIDAHHFLLTPDQKKVIALFYKDAYWISQMACSSPRLVCWLGDSETAEKARSIWWAMLETIVSARSDIETAKIIDKLYVAQALAIEKDVEIIPCATNQLSRVFLKSPDAIPFDFHCGGGLFYEMVIQQLSDLNRLMTRKIQTLTYFGVEKETLLQWLHQQPLNGVDRVVPVGSALDFHSVWDGYDLFRSFSREVLVD